MQLKVTCDPLPLVRFAATLAFKGMTITYLKKLHQHLGVPLPAAGGRPTTEAALLEAITRFVDPEISDGALKNILVLRNEDCDVEESCASPLFAAAGHPLELVASELDEELAAEVARYHDAAAKRDHAQAAKKAVAESMMPTPAAALPGVAVPGGPTAIEWPIGRGMTQPEAKLLVPANTTIFKDLLWHNRWQAKGSWMGTSYSKTFSASVSGTDNGALLQVLRLVWMRRQHVTGEVCPWDLDDSLF
jgi:hypothetical protein